MCVCVTVELPPQVGETETSKVLKLDQANGDEEEENKAEKANNLNIEVSSLPVCNLNIEVCSLPVCNLNIEVCSLPVCDLNIEVCSLPVCDLNIEVSSLRVCNLNIEVCSLINNLNNGISSLLINNLVMIDLSVPSTFRSVRDCLVSSLNIQVSYW